MRPRILILLWIILNPIWVLGASDNVVVELNGIGWRAGSRLERILTQVLAEPEPAVISGVQVEDLLFILRNELLEKGYLKIAISYTLTGPDDEIIAEDDWNQEISLPLIEWSQVVRIQLQVELGQRSYFEEISFTGLSAVSSKTAQSFFYPSGALFISEAERAYSPGGLTSGMQSLTQQLVQMGYLQAEITTSSKPLIAENGAVTVDLTVQEGPLFKWGEIELIWPEDVPEDLTQITQSMTPLQGPVRKSDAEALVRDIRNRLFGRGFADARVLFTIIQRNVSENSASARADIRLNIETGPQVRLGEIRFVGNEQTSSGFLQRTANQPINGPWLNPVEVDQATFALGQLGIFNSIDASIDSIANTEQPDRNIRNVVFSLEERDRYDLSVLFGWGSFEQLRLGVEGNALNLFGRAHVARFRLRQSFRSSGGQISYTIPRPFLGFTVAQARLAGLLRNEISFDRQEALVALGLRRAIGQSAWELSMEYRFELLRSRKIETQELIGDTRANVGNLLIGLARDTRDRVIFPREGSAFSGELELASTVLGGTVNYPRLEVRASHHQSLHSENVFAHFGFTAGVLDPLQMSDAAELPFNKRFFPGGENSIRGYIEGDASPQDAEGRAIGAEAFALIQTEGELRLTRSLSGVIFLDGLWTLDRFNDPDHTLLASIGMGLRYSTPLGPLRLEYGYNLNPRSGDPVGTLHFALGTAF